MRSLTIAMCCTVFCLPGRGLGQQPDSAGLKQRLIEIWDSWNGTVPGLRLKRTYSFYRTYDGKQEEFLRRDRIVFGLIGQLRMVGYDTEGFKDGKVIEASGELTISNASYKATLVRAKKQRGAWLLREFSMTPASGPVSKSSGRSACPWLICYNINMADWIVEPEFNFDKLESLSNGTRRLHFTYVGNKYMCPSGWLDIDFERKGIILGYEFNLKSSSSQGKETARYDYIAVDGTPVLTSRSIERSQQLANSTLVKSRELDEYETELKAPPEEEFYLTCYGIPEPAGAKPHKQVPRACFITAYT